MKRLLVIAAIAAAPVAVAAPASAAPYCTGLWDAGDPQAAVCVFDDECLVSAGGELFTFGLCLP